MQEEYCTLPEKLTEVIKQSPNKIVLQIKKSEGYVRYTYQDLFNQTQAVAQSLVISGIQKGDRVAIVLENRPEWVFIYFGILFAGGVAIPLDPQSTLDEFKYFLENSEAKIIFISPKFEKIICEAAKTVPSLSKVVLLDCNNREKTSEKILFFPDFLRNNRQELVQVKISLDDIASILYTSGTTGKPKGVMLTHRNFYSNFHGVNKLNVFDSDHNVLSILPLHHSFPFVVTLIIPIFSQAQVTFIANVKKEEILQCMQEAKVTIFAAVPQFFYLFYQSIMNEIRHMPFFTRMVMLGLTNLLYKLRQLTGINLNKLFLEKVHATFGKSLKYFVSGGVRLDGSIEVFFSKIGFTIIQGYGLTETAPVVTFNPITKPRIGSVGKVIPDVNLRIIEPDANGIGEVAICGPNVMLGYYKREKDTLEVLQNNWFYSGDLGYIDSKGYLFLTGRKKELIKLSAGKNISPEEVEEHYLKGRYIKELCVLAVGNNENEKLVAVIVPDFEYFKKTGEIEIYATIRLEVEIFSKDYPLYKCIMGFVLTKDPLPRTHLGKLKRYEIQEKYLSELMGIKPHVVQNEEMSLEELEIISSEIYKTITSIIEREKQLTGPLHLNDQLGMDLGYDSLSRIELISALEKQFGVNIPESEVAKILTLKDLTLIITQLIVEQKPQGIKDNITSDKENLWQNILITNPTITIIDKIALIPHWLVQTCYLGFCAVFGIISKAVWRLQVSGQENLPRDIPFILCPNHASYLDAFLILASLPNWVRRTVFFLGYHIYFTVPIIRNLVKAGRVIPLDPATNLVDAMRACSYVLRHNKTVCIFPEGGRSPDGSTQPFKKGVGILAKELNIPLIPVYIKGSFQALPRDKFWPNLNSIQVVFGKPCMADDLRDLGMRFEAKNYYEAIAKGLEKEVESLRKNLS